MCLLTLLVEEICKCTLNVPSELDKHGEFGDMSFGFMVKYTKISFLNMEIM